MSPALLLLVACAGPPAPPAPIAVAPGPATAVAPGPATAVAPGPTIAARLGEWSFLSAIDAPVTVALTAGGEIATDPATCGSCHVAHYAEWRETTHAAAIHDPQYLAELAKPGQPRWLCLNCHAPTQPQRSVLVTPETRFTTAESVVAIVAVANPTFLPARADEGIGCATCHVRRDADGQGIVVGPRGSGRAPHRVRVDREALTGICVTCHSPGAVEITPTFVCWFETAGEIAAGPDPTATCTGCHMPEVQRPVVPGGPELSVRRHVWVGGGVPKRREGYDALLARGWTPAVQVAVAIDPVRVSLVNAGAAHKVPTADPERFLRVEARFESETGATLARDVLRIGQTWDWGDNTTGRRAHRLTDTRLDPGETRVWSPDLAVADARRLVVEVAHVRMTPENAAWASGAVLDPELTALWPAAPALLPELPTRYPLATWIYREVIDLRDGERTVSPLAELLERSAAFMDAPLEAKKAALGER